MEFSHFNFFFKEGKKHLIILGHKISYEGEQFILGALFSYKQLSVSLNVKGLFCISWIVPFQSLQNVCSQFPLKEHKSCKSRTLT